MTGCHAGPPLRSACHWLQSTDSAGGPIQAMCGISAVTDSGVADAFYTFYPFVKDAVRAWEKGAKEGEVMTPMTRGR